MKFLKKTAAIAVLIFCTLHALSQATMPPLNEPDYNKPKLFSDLPGTMSLRLTDMEALLNLPVGTRVSAIAATGFPLLGIIVSTSNPADATVKTVVIKSTTRQGATFTFSRMAKEDGSFFYTGRMMAKGAGDALEIVKEGTGYVIRKKELYAMINE